MVSINWRFFWDSLVARFLPAPAGAVPERIYDFRVGALDGGVIDFSRFSGKKILIVNTASRCGHTPQYEALEALYRRYAGRLVIVGFPSNNFLFQEPGTNGTIDAFCKENYNITFPMAAKVSVRGREMAPVYRWLTRRKYNGYRDSIVKWNFQKYLVDEQGKLTHIFPPSTRPDSPELIRAIDG